MGGFGSGFQGVKKATVERSFGLDVNWLKREGFLIPWHGFYSVTWSNPFTKEKLGNICIYREPSGENGILLRLKYSIRHNFEKEEVSVDQRVTLETTEPYFGGVRWWFTCPFCERRVGKIYLPPRGSNYFACRICHDLTYRSCQNSDKRVSFYRRNPEAMLEAWQKVEDGDLDIAEMLHLFEATRKM